MVGYDVNVPELDDEKYAYVAAWENKGNHTYELHKEELKFEAIKIAARSYK